MTSTTNILILGATGYIGSPILLELLRHPDAATFNVTALVRSSEKAEKLKALNLPLNVVLGSSDNEELLRELTQNADVIMDTYNSDDMVGTANILKGCKARFDATRKKTSVIHVSGVGILTDFADGKLVPNEVWDDTDVEKLSKLPVTNSHRDVDIELLKADEEGYITTFLVIPGAVFGNLSNILSEAGITRTNAVVFTITSLPVITFGGISATIGGGQNRWSIVDVLDVAELVITIFNSRQTAPHGSNGFYFAENGDVEMRWIAGITARVVLGPDVTSIEERPLTKEELATFFPGQYALYIGSLASNTRCRGTRGRALGWNPKRGVEELKGDIEGWTHAALKK